MNIAEEQVAARYVAVSDHWTDMPEANPRARVKTDKGEAPVIVDTQGRIHVDADAGVEVDTYQDPVYEALRLEGEAWHENRT